jgi:NitT/TauT family transport system substrate-binding protein
MRKLGWSAAAAFAFILSNPLQSTQSAELRSWRHGIVQPKGDAGFVAMVKEGGFAERQGLALTLVPLQNDALLVKALVAGEIDSYQAGTAATLVAASHGAKLAILGCSWTGLPQSLFVRPGIDSIDSLAGKSLAISAPGAQADLLARMLLLKHGMKAEALRFVDMGSDADRFKALVAGKVDAAISSSEFDREAAAAGIKSLVAARDVAPDFVRFCEVTSAERLAKSRDSVLRFLAADILATRHALADRAAEIAVTRKLTGLGAEDERAPAMYDFVRHSRAVDPDLAIPADKLAWMQDLLVQTGNIAKPVDLAPLLASDLNREAKALADREPAPVPSGSSGR